MATVNLDCKLDLKTIAFHARNVEYNPKVGNPKNGGGFFLHQAESSSPSIAKRPRVLRTHVCHDSHTPRSASPPPSCAFEARRPRR